MTHLATTLQWPCSALNSTTLASITSHFASCEVPLTGQLRYLRAAATRRLPAGAISRRRHFSIDGCIHNHLRLRRRCPLGGPLRLSCRALLQMWRSGTSLEVASLL